MDKKRPFSGIKVIELATYLAAPACGRILADWGAEVIKVETLRGDSWRKYGDNFNVPTDEGENPLFDIINAGKKSLALNLKAPEGKDMLEKLLSSADVFITNNRLAPLKRMGLDYEALRMRYPSLIYALLTGYGENGPDAAQPGFDTAAFWAAGGFMADLMVDEPGAYPIYTPAGMGDIVSGSILFGGISAALAARARTGLGDKVSVSLFGTAVWSMGIMSTISQEKYRYSYPKKRRDSKGTAIPYRCADGEWILPSIIEYARDFPTFCQVMGVPELAKDPRYLTEASMMEPENKASLLEILEKQFITQTSEYWDKALTSADLVHSRLRHFRDISCSEQARANHYVDEVIFRNGSSAWLPRPALHSESLGLPDYELAPPLGEDSENILMELGYTKSELHALASRGIVGIPGAS